MKLVNWFCIVWERIGFLMYEFCGGFEVNLGLKFVVFRVLIYMWLVIDKYIVG